MAPARRPLCSQPQALVHGLRREILPFLLSLMGHTALWLYSRGVPPRQNPVPKVWLSYAPRVIPKRTVSNVFGRGRFAAPVLTDAALDDVTLATADARFCEFLSDRAADPAGVSGPPQMFLEEFVFQELQLGMEAHVPRTKSANDDGSPPESWVPARTENAVRERCSSASSHALGMRLIRRAVRTGHVYGG